MYRIEIIMPNIHKAGESVKLKEKGWDYPLSEIPYLLEEHSNETFYLGLDGRLYETDLKKSEEYYLYVVFCIGQILRSYNRFEISELDVEFERCKKLAKEFIYSDYDNSREPFIECLEEFLNTL